MGPAEHLIFVVNSGSSSIKFAVYECGNTLHKKLDGQLKGIGSKEGRISISDEQRELFSKPFSANEHADAIPELMEWLRQFSNEHPLRAIGHRIVHGGNRYFMPQLITADVLAELRRISPLNPEHLPDEILLAETLGNLFPNIPQIACFDTAFHRDMPTIAKLLPIPRRYFEMGIRRYGFHGLSCEYLMNTLHDSAATHNKVILAHLGNGASITAVYEGRSIDTSMGLTPCSGLPMSSRAGDLDPGLVLQLAQLEQMNAQQFHNMVNHESGLKGLSGLSGNISELLAMEKTNSRAADAIEYFCYQTRKWICSLAGALGGLHTLVFSGGIGEHLPGIRARICEKLDFIGVVIDHEKNNTNKFIISSAESQVKVCVIKTNEELIIANNVVTFLDQQKGKAS